MWGKLKGRGICEICQYLEMKSGNAKICFIHSNVIIKRTCIY